MNLEKSIKDIASYNTWANYQLILWLQKADRELIQQKVPSSFTTIKSTFLHIWNAERFWLSFLQKKGFQAFQKDFTGNEKDFFDGIHRQSHDFEMFVNSLSVEQLNENYTIDMPWLRGTKPCYVFIQHVVNHSTYHRGQLITLGRILELENPPNTDYTKYLMNVIK